jgi:hypothetical protein
VGHDFGVKSRVHSKYKTKYRVSNWAEYDRALVKRVDINMCISTDATGFWKSGPSSRRGGQRKFSDHAIEIALMLRLVFKFPLRQAEGLLRSLLSLIGVDLKAPDHTTHAWRSQHLDVDRSGVILAEVLTDENSDDAKTARSLIDEVGADNASFATDAVYDTGAIYDAAAARRQAATGELRPEPRAPCVPRHLDRRASTASAMTRENPLVLPRSPLGLTDPA